MILAPHQSEEIAKFFSQIYKIIYSSNNVWLQFTRQNKGELEVSKINLPHY